MGEFDSFFVPRPDRPPADIRGLAVDLHDLFVALKAAGFTTSEARDLVQMQLCVEVKMLKDRRVASG